MSQDYILYIGQDKRDETRFCAGSRAALEAIDQAKAENLVSVQSVDRLALNTTLPDWLDGTPMIVCRKSRRAYKGTECVNFIRSMAASSTESSVASDDKGGEDAWGG